MKKSIEKLSTEELEAALKARKSPENALRIKKRKEYENEREKLIARLFKYAQHNEEALKTFHDLVFNEMAKQREKLNEYGEIRSNSKGGFHIVSNDGNLKIVFKYVSQWDYDERAIKAEELLKDFLGDTIKKKDETVFKLILSLLEKNKAGQFEYSRIASLYKYENDFDDERWKQAINLFKESFKEKTSKMSIYFQKKDDKGVFQNINLNFSAL